MADTEAREKEVMEAANVLGIQPNVEDDDTMGEPLSLAEEPDDEEEEVEAAEEPEAEAADEEDEGEEEEAPRSSLDLLSEKLNPPSGDEDDDLRQQIKELKAWRDQQAATEREEQRRLMSKLDQVITGREEPETEEEADLVAELSTPEVAKMLSDAQDDPQRQLQIINTLSDQIADKKIERRLKPLEQRLNQQDESARETADREHRVQQAAMALKALKEHGGTAAELAKEFEAKRGGDSYLMEAWTQNPALTNDYRSMVVSAMGIASLIDGAVAQGNDEPVSTTQPARAAVLDTASKSRASRRGSSLNQPKTTEDPAQNVLANLRKSMRLPPGGGSLNDI